CLYDENGVTSFIDSEWVVPPTQNIKLQIAPIEGYVDEADILQWLRSFAGYKYTFGIPHYPFKLWDGQGDNLLENPAHPETKVNSCNAFTESLLVKAWESVYDGTGGKGTYTWNLGKHNMWMIGNTWDKANDRFGADEFGPITAAIGEPT